MVLPKNANRRFTVLRLALFLAAVGLGIGSYRLRQTLPPAASPPPAAALIQPVVAPPLAAVVTSPTPPDTNRPATPILTPQTDTALTESPAATDTALTESPAAIAPSRRSSALLQACWTSTQLRGLASDRQITRQHSNLPPPTSALSQQTELSPRLTGSIRAIKPDHSEKLVALTFDLCEMAHEKSGYDADIVNYLRDHQVKATFFAGGKWMRSHPEKAMQLMADPLFELGNHTWTHGNLRTLNSTDRYNQIRWTQAEYQLLRETLLKSECALKLGHPAAESIPPALTVFRFPYGACNGDSLRAVNQLGLAAIQWNIVTGDPAKGQTAEKIARVILSQAQPGSIVVAHANGRGWHTAQALPQIVSGLSARGYRFVTISELLARGEVVAADSCYELKPGDNLKYDRLFKTDQKR